MSDEAYNIPINPGNGKPRGQPGRPSNAWRRAKALMELKEYLENGGSVEAWLGEQYAKYQREDLGGDRPQRDIDEPVRELIGRILGGLNPDDPLTLSILTFVEPMIPYIVGTVGISGGIIGWWYLEETGKVPPILHLLFDILVITKDYLTAGVHAFGEKTSIEKSVEETGTTTQKPSDVEESPAESRDQKAWWQWMVARGYASPLSGAGGGW